MARVSSWRTRSLLTPNWRPRASSVTGCSLRCRERMIAASRFFYDASVRYLVNGFRVAAELN